MKRIKVKLNESKSKTNINRDTSINVGITSNENIIPIGEINHVVNVGEQFNKERNLSNSYRLIFTISPLFSNVLYNVNGNINLGTFGNSNIPIDGNGLETFSDPLFLEDPYDNIFTGQIDLTYQESLDRHLKEVNGWFGFKDPDLTKSTDCDFYDLEPTRRRFDLNSNVYNNWDYIITYPHRNINNHILVEGGLLVVNAISVTLGGIPMLALGTSTYHGLNNGDSIILSDMPSTVMNGTFKVKRLGDDEGNFKNNFFVIELNPTELPIGNLFTSGRVSRIINGQVSSYYIRIFKRIEESVNNYEIYPLAYSKTIFNDQIMQLSFNNDIILDNMYDNLGRPISELYLTFIKTTYTGKLNYEEFFTDIKSGFDLEFLSGNINEDVSNIRRIHDGPNPDLDYFTSQTPLETNINVDYDEYYGDIVEYNNYELIEKKLTGVLHRFNTLDRESTSKGVADGPRREGYLYNPFIPIKIKNYSSYIEQGDASTEGIPDYAVDLEDGRWLWRELLDYGFSDINNSDIEFPFTNGNHYVHKNICFGTNRQDPFGYYDLYYGGIYTETKFSPGDPIGDGINNRFINKTENNEC